MAQLQLEHCELEHCELASRCPSGISLLRASAISLDRYLESRELGRVQLKVEGLQVGLIDDLGVASWLTLLIKALGSRVC